MLRKIPIERARRAWITTLAVAVFSPLSAQAQDPAVASAGQTYGELMALPLQLRLEEAMSGLASIDLEGLSPGQRGTLACMRERFNHQDIPASSDLQAPVSAERTAAAILEAYRRYWHKSLWQGTDAAESGREAELLRQHLQALLKQPAHADWDQIEHAMTNAFDAVGWHSLRGVTPPLRELIIWTDEQTIDERVALPGGTEQVKVVFMDGFTSRGWANYATCGRSSAGGWTADDGLYAVSEDYDRDSEAYKVSYLAHEGQHFRDKRRFRGETALPPWRLEYRAKLVELVIAVQQQAHLLETFSANTSNDTGLPHSHANQRVLAGLDALLPGHRAWSEASSMTPAEADALRGAARKLLQQDDQSLAQPAVPVPSDANGSG